ncbi:hypothetical protein [Absidia glauca]|uniref:Uncharacterized protein n=1 Tax=Absidia glauca TaxID=4829 RepID=A0A168KZI8_ABSGL|nr:hypothetical protein [Absidia glauca]
MTPSQPSEQQKINDLPEHIPVDMAAVPNAHPYKPTNKHIPQRQPSPTHHQHGQHSLSPEQLGVVGYVRDVAGFVKDTVNDIREDRQRRRSSDAAAAAAQIEDEAGNKTPKQEDVVTTSPPPSAHQQLASSPLANVVTGLFPGISGSGQQQQQQSLHTTGSPPPCTHADALRQDLREQLQHSSDKEHRLL